MKARRKSPVYLLFCLLILTVCSPIFGVRAQTNSEPPDERSSESAPEPEAELPQGQNLDTASGQEPQPEVEANQEALTETTKREVDPKDAEKEDKARKHFRQGVAFAKAGNCEGAVAQFNAAHVLVPRPNALYNIAQCQERLFRYDLAVEYYKRYLREAPQDAPDRLAVEGALNTLSNLLGVLRVASNRPAQVWVDDRLMGEAPGDVYAPPGRYIVELRAKGYLPSREEVQLAAREQVELSFELIKARTTVRVTEKAGLPPIYFWTGVGVTAVAGVVTAVLGIRVLSLKSDAEKVDKYLYDEAARAKRDVEKAELTTDIVLITTGVLAAGTTVIGFLTNWESSEEKKPATGESSRSGSYENNRAVRLAPRLGSGFIGLDLVGDLR